MTEEGAENREKEARGQEIRDWIWEKSVKNEIMF